MVSVKKYMEYRDFLRDYYTEMKKECPFYSLRYMGNKVTVDPSHLVKIFQRQRHIGTAHIEVFIKHCSMSAGDAEYFENLVHFNKAKSDRDSKLYFERLLALRGVNAHSLEKYQYEYYTKWYHSAILTLLDYYPFTSDYAELGAVLSPAITETQARRSVALLKKIGLIVKRADGTWHLTNKIITTGEHYRSIAVKSFQEETMKLAIESLERHAPEKRNISTVTITIAEKNLETFNEVVRNFRETLLKLARDEATPDKVYQLNVQLFPLTK